MKSKCKQTKMVRTRLSLFGSSHFSGHRFFPEIFRPLFWDHRRYFMPRIYATGGQRLNSQIVDQIFEVAEQNAHVKQVIIINLSKFKVLFKQGLIIRPHRVVEVRLKDLF